jgi:hypothetical protein
VYTKDMGNNTQQFTPRATRRYRWVAGKRVLMVPGERPRQESDLDWVRRFVTAIRELDEQEPRCSNPA